MLSKKTETTELWEDWRGWGVGGKQTFRAPGSAFPQELTRAHGRAHGMAWVGMQHGVGPGAAASSPTFSPAVSAPSEPGPHLRPRARSRAQGGHRARLLGAQAGPERDPERYSPSAGAPAYLGGAPAPARRPGRAPGSGDREEEELGPREALQAGMKWLPGPCRRLGVERVSRTGPDRAATEGWADGGGVCSSAPKGRAQAGSAGERGRELRASCACPRAADTPPERPAPSLPSRPTPSAPALLLLALLHPAHLCLGPTPVGPTPTLRPTPPLLTPLDALRCDSSTPGQCTCGQM